MQSATSFFNRALFRKNLQRFWPLWLGYVLIWLLLLPLPLLNELADYHGVPTVADASYYLLQIGAYGGLVMGAVFGIFFAMAMFAYLTNPRATQGFHSMPVRRETLYATNYLTGLVCMVSALVLAFALAGITAACFGALNLTALGTALLAAVLSVLLDAAVDGTEVVKADTIEELAALMGVDADTLVKSVETYNTACVTGNDTEFGKGASNLTAIDAAPYYAVRIYVCTGGTIAGVKTNLDFQVLREDGSVINGLYAGGETSNREMYAYAYSSGSGVGYALASGRQIGMNLMK